MTKEKHPEKPSLDAALRAASTSFLVTIEHLEDELSALRAGANCLAPNQKEAVRAVNASLQLLLKERDKFEDLRISERGTLRPGDLDLGTARQEILRRFHSLRTAGDAG